MCIWKISGNIYVFAILVFDSYIYLILYIANSVLRYFTFALYAHIVYIQPCFLLVYRLDNLFVLCCYSLDSTHAFY